MRTARGVVKLIRVEDPGTEITEYHVRKIIKKRQGASNGIR